MPPIPVLLCGKFPTHVAAVSAAIIPTFTVAHHSPSTSDAITYLSTQPLPIRLIIMGAGFSPEDFSAVRAAPNGTSVPWLRPAHTNPDGKTKPPEEGPPSAEVVAERCKRGLQGKADRFREDGGVEGWAGGEVWYF